MKAIMRAIFANLMILWMAIPANAKILSFGETKEIVLREFENNKTQLANEIRRKRPEFANASDDMVFSRGNCQYASEAFMPSLISKGLEVVLTTTKIHAFLTVRVSFEDGTLQEVVIDPTFRQLFKPCFDPLWGRGFLDGALRGQDYLPYYAKYHVPFVAIAPTQELKAYLESFVFPPGWITANKVIKGAFPPFEEWYMKRDR